MFYKKALAFSVITAMLFTTACSTTNNNNSDSTEETSEIYVPQGSSVTNGNVTVKNGSDMSVPPTDEEKVEIRLGMYNSASALCIGHLLENDANNVSYEKYSYTSYNTPTEVVNALQNSEIDAAALPLNEAVKLFNSTNGKYMVAMVDSLFNYCIADIGQNINSDITALSGKTITVASDDTVGKLVLNKLIKDYEISNCTINTVDSTSAIVNGLANGSITLALTQEPYISQAMTKNNNVKLGIDLYDSWFEKGNSDIVTGCLVVPAYKINSDKKSVVYFMKDYEASVILTRKNIDESSQLAAKYYILDSVTSKSAIPGCSISSKTGQAMVDVCNKTLNFINSVDSSAIGGIVPTEGLYFTDTE